MIQKRKLSIALSTVLASLAMAGLAQAQTSSGSGTTSGTTSTTATGSGPTTSSSSGMSSSAMFGGDGSMFAAGSGYLGFNLGQSTYRLNNGLGGFGSQQRKNSYNIYGGGYFSENVGVQLGYTDFDRISRAGGTTYANGFTVSLVGRLPVAPSFNLLGRLGTTYSRTDVSSNPASGIAAGKASGWGASYGVGAEYMFSPNWSGVVQYDEYRMKFAGTGREKINVASLGVRYKF